ncbi:DUF1002 domain-containing protein [Ihubacter massiliensis]|uniref:DUF1002 domain-containing protein n=1 Tax=Hominibacterium faecale TaxID=2839743 RepID=A0A9J6QYP8_9FIRM|nr:MULTISPECIES: DUF1002 domain-containing protein [Eubacteriales Family XIII. Incertae Sedis]MCO7120482.1 DUF1002 domain-containing protein [Ihubacter massiliensis]MCU7380607.1 DUF1002 domain-containing protein [Hominibacterium faecale]MDY3013447.1 DUF1002 domain-containing protein [Clostridiales Family XIII bacterium]
MIFTVMFQLSTLTVSADSSKVVTLGANISKQQRADMYEYFGTTPEQVQTIEVNNSDERKYMEGIATEQQIGRKTFSCSYIEPTDSGGVQVKTANLTFVTSSMIASTLATSGIENCNVVAAAPIAVSGTGALTGIMMAYETASGQDLNEGQKEAAVEELVTTGEIADSVGQEQASALVNDVKEQVIEDNLTDASEIQKVVDEAASNQGVTLTKEQMDKIVALMKTISQYDYDVKALKNTLDNLEGKGEGFFAGIWNSIKGFFGGGSDGGIINDTKDTVLGDDAVINSTLDDIKSAAEDEGLWDKIVNFFKGLFGSDDESTDGSSDQKDSTQASESSKDSKSTSNESTSPQPKEDKSPTDETSSSSDTDGTGASQEGQPQ